MTNPFILTISGRPVPCPRPRVTPHGVYYNNSYLIWRDVAGWTARIAMNEQEHPGFGKAPVALVVRVYLKTRDRADLDNYIKAVGDALQGILFDDDRQIQRIEAALIIGTDEPRVEIEVQKIEAVEDVA